MHPSGAAQKTASITPRPAAIYAAPSPSPSSPPRQDPSGARHRPAVLGKRTRRCGASPPIGSAANTGSETPQPPREDAMLEITRISLPKDAPAAKGRCARGTGRHWPEPQRLGTEPDSGLLGRLSGTPRAADSPLPPPPKKRKRERHLISRHRCRLYSHRAFPTSPPHLFSREYRLGDAPAVKGRCHAWDYPHFPVERRSCRQGEMRPWNGAALA